MEDISREACNAVFLVSSLKYVKIDDEIAEDMEKARREAINKKLISMNSLLPPVPSLIHRIEYCSQPLIKELEESDVKNNQSRLSLKTEFVKKEFLPIANGDGNVKDGIEVMTYDSNGFEYENMVFKLWGEKMYVLTREWKFFSEHHKLVTKDTVKVWMFRDKHTGKLSVVIHPILQDISREERERIRNILNQKASGSNRKPSRK